MKTLVSWGIGEGYRDASDPAVILCFQLSAANISLSLMSQKADWLTRCLNEAVAAGFSPSECYLLEYRQDSMRTTFIRRGVPVSEFRIVSHIVGEDGLRL